MAEPFQTNFFQGPRGLSLSAAWLLLSTAVVIWVLTRRRTANPPCMLLPAAAQVAPLGQEDQQEGRRAVSRALAAGQGIFDGPEPPEVVIASIVRHLLDRHQARRPEDLSPIDLHVHHLLVELLHSPPARAGALAQKFGQPDAILDLREQVQAAAEARRRYMRQTQVLESTSALWERQQSVPPKDLVDALQRMDVADPDLWHWVVAMHDPSNASQRAGAMYAVTQTGTSQATVALYLSRMAGEGHLVEATKRGDFAWLFEVLMLIQSWNEGAFRDDRLGLEPRDLVLHDGPRFKKTLLWLARETELPCWPMPQGLFRAYPGETAQDRSDWDLDSGLLKRAPRRDRYVTAA